MYTFVIVFNIIKTQLFAKKRAKAIILSDQITNNEWWPMSLCIRTLLLCLFFLSALLLHACASLRYENNVDIFISPSHKSAPKSSDPRINIFQFIDNDRNAYITRWTAKSNTAKAFSAAKLDCLDAQAETMAANKATPISKIESAMLAPDNYKALVKCIYDSGYNLVGRDSFYPDLFTLTFARKHLTEAETFSPSGKRHQVKKSAASFSDVFNDAKACSAQLEKMSDNAEEEISNWEADYARPFKEEFINCLVSRGYRVWQQ